MAISIAQIDFSASVCKIKTAHYCLHCHTWVTRRILIGLHSPHGPWRWVNIPCGCIAELKQCLKPEALTAVTLL